MTSYQPSHAQAQQSLGRDKPSPLRIIKRHRRSGTKDLANAIRKTSTNDSQSTVSSVTHKAKLLHVSRRRARKASLINRDFWASSVDLSHHHIPSWEAAVASCRGLLRRSTPNFNNFKRRLSIGRSCRPRNASGGGMSSSGSSRQDGEANPCRPSSTSPSDEESRSTAEPRDRMRPQTPRASPQRLSPRQISRNSGGAYFLSPCISLTTHRDELSVDKASVWVAVEITRKLSHISPLRPKATEEPDEEKLTGTFVHHNLDRFFDFGCLYNLTVDVDSTPNTTILEVIHEHSWPTTIYAGTSALLVVHVQLQTASTGRCQSGHGRCRSDELMEELELELGNTQTELFTIKVCYQHSAFPKMVPDEGPRNGLRHLESRLETTATAALVRNSVSSVWSPRPETKQNSIFSIMVQHWGDEKAMTIRRQISDSHVLPRQRKAAQQAVATASSKLSAATESSGDKDLFTLNHEPETNHFGASPPLCPSSDDGWRSWCGNLLDGSDVLGEGLRKPVSEVYYFGEQAIKALGTPAAPKPDSGRKDASGKMCAGMMLDAKVQGSGFWDWGSWF